jgi:hypothetical protein
MDESLAGLTAAFEEWRSSKRHPREAVPVDILKRARQVARRHGRSRSGNEGGAESTQDWQHEPACERCSRSACARLLARGARRTGGGSPAVRRGRDADRPEGSENEALELLSSLCGAGRAR